MISSDKISIDKDRKDKQNIENPKETSCQLDNQMFSWSILFSYLIAFKNPIKLYPMQNKDQFVAYAIDRLGYSREEANNMADSNNIKSFLTEDEQAECEAYENLY